MKQIGIKVIKRSAVREVTEGPQLEGPVDVTANVTEWIEESRKNRLAEDSFSRQTIRAWTAEPLD